MADKEKKSESSSGAINSNQRFRYIGFEVFPGKPKDLFKSETEKKKYEADVLHKREQGGVQRDHITLLEERISLKERIILSVACLVILGSLFLPWFSAYQVIQEESVVEPVAPAEEALLADSLAGLDSLGLAVVTDVAAGTETALADVAEGGGEAVVDEGGGVGSEEVIHSAHVRKKIRKEYMRVSWFGTFLSFADISRHAFSSATLMLTSVMLLLYMLLALTLPIFCLYALYGLKDKGDVLALKLKRYFRLNWIPVILFLAVFVLSFFGGPFDIPTTLDAAGQVVPQFTSLSTDYSIGVLGDTLSWGIFVSLAMFVLVAVKAIEI